MTEPETPMTKQMILDEYKQAIKRAIKALIKKQIVIFLIRII